MKATHKDFLRGPPPAARDARIFFFCGPDEAGATAAANRVAEALADAGERSAFADYLTAYTREQQSLGRFSGQPRNRLRDAHHPLVKHANRGLAEPRDAARAHQIEAHPERDWSAARRRLATLSKLVTVPTKRH